MKRRLPLIPLGLQNRVLQQLTAVLGEAVNDFFNDDTDVSIKSAAYPARIVRVERETPRALTLELSLEGGYRLNYRAGQSVCLTCDVGPVLFRRHYALSSSPEEHRLTITVKKIFHGRLSSYLLSRLLVGQRVYIEEPEGDFVLPADAPHEQRYVMVAAGSGIAPVRALIADVLGKNPSADIRLLYCCRSADDVIFKRELEGWERRHGGFTLHLCYTRREGYSHEISRRLTGEQCLSLVGDVSGANFYICAPAGLTKVVTDALASVGVPETAVHIQLFSAQAHVSETAGLKPRNVVFEAQGLMSSRYSVKQSHVGTLAEAAREAGVRVDQQCSAGNCQSCKVKIVHGSAVMDEPNGLSIEDAAQGYVLACVAYPCEDVVVQLPR